MTLKEIMEPPAVLRNTFCNISIKLISALGCPVSIPFDSEAGEQDWSARFWPCRIRSNKFSSLSPQSQLAREIAKYRYVLYLGRGTSFAIALEGALKLKEVSYLHAEGCAAGELKHWPIALVEEGMPVVVIASYDTIFEKTSNMQEVVAPGGRIIQDGRAQHRRIVGDTDHPECGARCAPLFYAASISPTTLRSQLRWNRRRRDDRLAGSSPALGL
jgi:SIS domain